MIPLLSLMNSYGVSIGIPNKCHMAYWCLKRTKIKWNTGCL